MLQYAQDASKTAILPTPCTGTRRYLMSGANRRPEAAAQDCLTVHVLDQPAAGLS